MITYRTAYEVLGRVYGIEDYEQKGTHFGKYAGIRGGSRKRFALWAGGCGIGEADTYTRACELLHTYICMQLDDDIKQRSKELGVLTGARRALGSDVRGLKLLTKHKQGRAKK